MKQLAIAILFLGVVALVGGSRLLRLYNPQAIAAKQKVDLYLPQSVNLQRLDFILEDSLHVVDDKQELNWAAHLLGWRTFQPGHYTIDHGFTYNEFLSKLARGIQDPITLTIVPGQRKSQIISFLTRQMRFDSTSLSTVLADSLFLTDRNIAPKTLVAYFFPATYDIYWTTPPKKVLVRIFDEFVKQVVQRYQKSAVKHDLTLNEVLTLASIVEGEAVHDDEKPKISGLYLNRLNKNMLLQADPTVSYALDERRRLYFKDYEVDDPYNTYIHKGLPPGPINNPSLSSIKAVLNPAENDYLYMVARPDGYHAFSKTYAEHQRKRAQWQKYLKKMESKRDSVNN